MTLPAVALMAKVPGTVAVKSRLHEALGAARATELYRCFLLDTVDGVAGLPGIAPLVAFTPAGAGAAMAALLPPGVGLLAQEGDDLGARMANVMAALFDAGHPAVVVLGTDSPTLPIAYVGEATSLLTAGGADLVLGPTDDGGYYLVGLGAPAPGLFAEIPWSSPEVLELTLARARSAGLRTHLLPAWFDVDTEPDLRRLAQELRAGGPAAPHTRAFVTAHLG